ncbi:MAG: beta-ketoacyl-ACP synthase II [Ignavibacteriaceae bacterium]|nr:beta-ketoacyl-ACP synthase II [Ignavibacteriaceae bacterium]
MRKRVVVTGLGTINPIGLNTESFWESLVSAKSGVDFITRFDTGKFDTKFAAEVKNFDPSLYLDKKAIRRLDLFSQYAIASSDQAVKDAGISSGTIDPDRTGIVYGSGIGGVETMQEQHFTYFETKDPSRISPFFITMMIADIAAGHISIRYGFKGPNYSTTSACATSSHAIADAFMIIQRGGADVMLCGGSEACVTQMAIGGFNAMRALSVDNENYKTASKPFDLNRNGFVMGEGSGTIILEDLEHALARGAKIYAEIKGIGLTADAYHMTQPHPDGDGAVRSMRLSVRDAGIKENEVDYINAHGTSTPFNDVTETKAIKSVFGDYAYKLNVSSIKSMTGHLLGAAGAIEAIATILAVKNDIIPPTINYVTPDPQCDLNYTPNKAVKKTVRNAISNTFGFGGHNASLLFSKFVN